MPGEIELADDVRPQQRHDVRALGEVEAGEDLFGHRRAAHDVPPLEDEHPSSRAREIGRRSEAIVAATDHDHVVGHGGILYGREGGLEGGRLTP